MLKADGTKLCETRLFLARFFVLLFPFFKCCNIQSICGEIYIYIFFCVCVCEVLSGSVQVLPFSIRWQTRTSAQAPRQKWKEGITSHQPWCVCARACFLWFWDCFESDEWCKGLHVILRNLDESLEGRKRKRKQLFSLPASLSFCSLFGRWAHIYECWKKNNFFYSNELHHSQCK